MKKQLLIILLTAIVSVSYSQTKDNGQELIDTFFDLYKNKGYDAALKYTLTTNKWIQTSGGEMDNIIIRLEKEIKTMGEYIGYEELKSKNLGTRLRYVSYLVYYQRDPVRFTFALYKNGTGWEISDFQYDFGFDKEIEASMKLMVSEGH
ncbi:MAG: hypothetical protein HOP08_15080 [Cyclobacteriaceae bacterium]|nr:hypothetical protein [Cyclobacteriaceae bacterium]